MADPKYLWCVRCGWYHFLDDRGGEACFGCGATPEWLVVKDRCEAPRGVTIQPIDRKIWEEACERK